MEARNPQLGYLPNTRILRIQYKAKISRIVQYYPNRSSRYKSPWSCQSFGASGNISPIAVYAIDFFDRIAQIHSKRNEEN